MNKLFGYNKVKNWRGKERRRDIMRTRMMTVTIFFCLVLSVSVAGAATLSTASGTFANGQQVIITGSGFGTVPANVSFIDAESGAVGSTFSETGWTYSSASAGGAGPWSSPVYSNARALNGSKSILCSYPSGTYGCTFDIGYSLPITKAYVSFWVYGDYKAFSSTSDYHFQWKMFRVNPTINVSDTPATVMIAQWPKSDGTCYQAYHVNYVDTTYKINIPEGDEFWRKCFPRNEWIRMEIFLQESDLGTANGTEIIKYYSTSANNWTTWSNYNKNITTRATADRWKYVHFGQYIGNESIGKSADTYWDNVYVQQGTFARVELCDSSSWSSCQKRQVQKPVSWSASSIAISANSGPFATGDTAYLFFIDDAGNASNALTVKIGAASTTKTPTTLKRRW